MRGDAVDGASSRRPRRPVVSLPALAVGAVGLVMTVALGWATQNAHDENEERLLRQRTREAAAVLSATIPAIEVPLATASALAGVESGDPVLFRQAMSSQVGDGRRFASASLWSRDRLEPVVVVGDEPALASRPDEDVRAFLERSRSANALSVLDVLDGTSPRLGYAYRDAGGGGDHVVYAEQALPADRMSVVQPDSAFADLDYALYLETVDGSEVLLLASTASLPLEGPTADEVTDFGDSRLRLEMSPDGELGGALLARLPLVVVASGALLTTAGAVLAERLQRRRVDAERLAVANEQLYVQQRESSLALQQRLLPRHLPEPEGLDIAVRYAPGISGTEVGGDWYDVVAVDGRTYFIVGDVSGRGLPAASVMAAVRHGVRMLSSLGHGPAEVLRLANRPDTRDLDGHFATVLCARIDLADGTLTIASAGHPPPLLARAGGCEVVRPPIGPPIGAVRDAGYTELSVRVSAGDTLIMFTDGVFERRGEPVDAGLERLREACEPTRASAQELVGRLFHDLALGTGTDDAAILAVRWTT